MQVATVVKDSYANAEKYFFINSISNAIPINYLNATMAFMP